LGVPNDRAQLSVAIERQGEEAVVAVAGELDLSSAPQLEAALASLPRDQVAHVVFDLSTLRFIDSTGINVLVRCAAHHRVSVRAPTTNVRSVLEISGLNDALGVEP
jgi:anti-sigma B factor antagonist